MEINHTLSIPMEHGQSNLLLPPNHIYQDDQLAFLDSFFCQTEEPLLYEEALPIEKSASPENDHNFDKLSLTDLLLVAAESVESENWHLASSAIDRLDQILLNQEAPFLRLAYFFAQGLRHRALGPWSRPTVQLPTVSADDMSAYQMVQELSPYVKFAHFTANQAILEATLSDPEVHIIDFDIMEGLQWPPLMEDLARSRNGTTLRITAVVTEGNAGEVHRTGRRLAEFAESIGIVLKFDQLEERELAEFKPGEGRRAVANCMVHQFQMPSKSFMTVGNFFSNVKMVVLVEEELFSVAKATCKSFVEFFCEALHHFSSVSDSLSSGFYGGYKGGLRLVEKEILGPRIVDYVSNFPYGSLSLEGFRMIPLSSCNVSQAKFLVGLFSRGYGVENEKGRLALCWKSRPLITASIWVPK